MPKRKIIGEWSGVVPGMRELPYLKTFMDVMAELVEPTNTRSCPESPGGKVPHYEREHLQRPARTGAAGRHGIRLANTRCGDRHDRDGDCYGEAATT